MKRKFKVGDVVKVDEDSIGIVGWTDNKCANLTEEDGYLGIDLLTGSEGFRAPVKEEECTKSSIKEVIKWWENECREKEKSVNLAYVNRKRLNRLQHENKVLKELLSFYLEGEVHEQN